MSALVSPSKSPVSATFQAVVGQGERRARGAELGPVHEPQVVLARGRVAPQQVGAAVAVEVVLERPGRAGDFLERGGDAVHRRCQELVGRGQDRAVLDVPRRAGDVGAVGDRREGGPRPVRGRRVAGADLERDAGSRRGERVASSVRQSAGAPASRTRDVNVPLGRVRAHPHPVDRRGPAPGFASVAHDRPHRPRDRDAPVVWTSVPSTQNATSVGRPVDPVPVRRADEPGPEA